MFLGLLGLAQHIRGVWLLLVQELLFEELVHQEGDSCAGNDLPVGGHETAVKPSDTAVPPSVSDDRPVSHVLVAFKDLGQEHSYRNLVIPSDVICRITDGDGKVAGQAAQNEVHLVVVALGMFAFVVKVSQHLIASQFEARIRKDALGKKILTQQVAARPLYIRQPLLAISSCSVFMTECSL